MFPGIQIIAGLRNLLKHRDSTRSVVWFEPIRLYIGHCTVPVTHEQGSQ